MEYLLNLNSKNKTRGIGNKAESLIKLISLGFNVPITLVVPFYVREQFLKDPTKTSEILLNEIKHKLKSEKAYAVRSSSSLEDSSERSFAGQFDSYLNIIGADAIFEKIIQVWQSINLPDNSLYLHNAGPQQRAKMAVIVQEMVPALWSGVAFSINPVNGRPQTIIEGIRGSGEQIVQEGMTPTRWILMNGHFEEEVSDDSPGIEVLLKIENQLKELRTKVKSQIDLEWVYDGTELYIVQWRPITVNRFPVIFSNHISREVLPGIIKPLVWSVNIPLVNSAWIKLIEKIMGKLDLSPDDLSSSFYYRAYFNMGTFGELFKRLGLPPDSLENLMGRKKNEKKGSFKPSLKVLKYLPGLILFSIHFFHLLSRFRKKLKSFSKKTAELEYGLRNGITFENYHSHFLSIDQHCRDISYYNIVIPLYMNITNIFLQKKLKKNDLSLEDLNISADFPEIKDYDPNPLLQSLGKLWRALPPEIQTKINMGEATNDMKLKELEVFWDKIDAFKANFGHFSESGNDFSYPHWQENTAYIINLIKHFPTSEKNKSPNGPSHKTQKIRKLSVYKRAAKLRLYREMISSLYTKTYGLFRILFLDLGKQLVDIGKLDSLEDIFFCDLDRIEKLIESNDINFLDETKKHIDRIRLEISELRDVDLPSIIYGEQAPQLSGLDSREVFHGIPASMGYYEGEIRVVKTLDDFDHMVDNAILVIPYSDVSWTPILLRAGAIVSESGGMLSHASIIAREMGIPAIVSVDHACSIAEGIAATVDGQNGVLMLKN